MPLTMYMYSKCGTCRKALKLLQSEGMEVSTIDLIDTPPNREVLADLIEKSNLAIKKFFNTSGVVYKKNNLKEVVPTLSKDEQLDLLASDGKLIKRPIVTDGEQVTVGFKQEEYERVWLK